MQGRLEVDQIEKNLKRNIEAEEVFCSYFNDFDAIQNPTRGEKDYNYKARRYYGGVHIPLKVSFGDTHDVDYFFTFKIIRGCFISEETIKNYRGKFYVLIPNGNIEDPDNFRVLWNRTINTYYTKVPDEVRESYVQYYGVRGYGFYRQLRKETTLKDFRLRLLNSILTNYSLDSEDFYKVFHFSDEEIDQ